MGLQELVLCGDEHTVDVAVLPIVVPSPKPNRLHRWFALVVLLGGVTTLLAKRSLVVQVVRELRSLEVRAIVLLVSLVLAHRLLNATLHRAATPGVSIRNMLIAVESYSGAAQSFTGGAGVGTALRIGMYRSWGVDGVGITASIVASSVFPSFAMWILGGAYTLPSVVAGTANRNALVIGLGSIAFVLGPIVFWSVLLNHSSAVRWGQRAIRRIGTRFTKFRSRRVRDLGARCVEVAHAGIEDVRTRGRSLVRSNGLLMLGSAIGAQAVLSLILLASAWAVAPQTSLPAFTLIQTFAMLRVLSSFLPIPGGLGIIDVGLVSTLETAGLASSEAVAALALYRALTFVLPLITGPLCALAWWRTDGRDRVLRPVGVAGPDSLAA
jgi:putative heme transporter